MILAFIGLIAETGFMPTAEAVAARSGRSVRLVFDRFESLDALAAEAPDQFIEAFSLAPPHIEAADFPTRSTWYLCTRAAASEHWRKAWPVLLQLVRRNGDCHRRYLLSVRQERKLIDRLFARELASLSPSRRQWTITSLSALLSIDAWVRLREGEEMSPKAGRDHWRSHVTTLLGVGAPDSCTAI